MLTILEAAKLIDDPIRQAIIEIYAQNNPILRVMPMITIAGNSLTYNREDKLPGIGFRGVNEGYTESTGILNPQTEALAIAGGDLDVDLFIIKTMGEMQRAVQESMKTKALSLAWLRTFFKGDSVTDPREFDGLQARVVNDQLIPAGSTDGGDALSLQLLDKGIDAVENPTHLSMSKAMRRRLTQAAKTTTVGGNITFTKDEFGRQVTQYNDLPILEIQYDNEGSEILPFTEVGPGGATATCGSIYIQSFEPGYVNGLQNGDIDVRDLGEQQSKPAARTRLEWYSAFTVMHGRAAARIWGIKDLAFVA